MSDLQFYFSQYEIVNADVAFRKFVGLLQTYYDTAYYVNWKNVYTKAVRFESELALLSTLCKKPDKRNAAKELLLKYPQVIRALPALIGCRDKISVMEDVSELRVTTYEFQPLATKFAEAEAERYTHFLLESGLLELLGQINSVPDYVTGVEVGMDSNGRKNRSGQCAIKALIPTVSSVQHSIKGLFVKPEANYNFLASKGCCLPSKFKRKTWDWAFWSEGASRQFAVMEVNHYGGVGSKPTTIVAEYIERQQILEGSGVQFIWVTDGFGWLEMEKNLRDAFDDVRHLINIRLAADGYLEWVLRRSLFPEEK